MLLGIQALLVEPNLHEPFLAEVAALYHADRGAYERIAWHYTESEARVSQSDTDEATLDLVGD